jgi:hypothetical protein
MAGRVMHLSLDVLDRQLRDREGIECGKVDDLELSRDEEGGLWVTAILSGPGILWYRLGRRRLGTWLQRAARRAGTRDDVDRTRIPVELAASIGANVDLAVSRVDLASNASERWVGDHVIGHIPGHDHDGGE